MKKNNNKNTPLKPYPLPVVILADVLLLAVSLSVFCYFHHIRSLWGMGSKNNTGMTAVENVPDAAGETAAVFDTVTEYPTDNGDFGASFPHVFLPYSTMSAENSVNLTDDTAIREYLTAEQLTAERNLDCYEQSYLGLYRSHDIFATSEKISTIIHYNDKTYDVTYYLYDVYIRNLENLFTVAVDDREPIEDLALASYEIESDDGTFLTSPALLAVNGDYIGNDNHVYFAIRNNTVMRDNSYIGADICVLYNDGTMETLSMRDFNRQEVMNRKPYQVWEFGPSLLDENGEAIQEFYDDYYDDNVLTSRHPRSSIGYYEPGHYCFIVVDGRSEESQGVRMFQLGEIYEQLGCRAAYNLDGGDSAQSLWNGEAHRTDEDRRLDGEDQRKLYDIVCIGEVTKK